MGNKSINNFLNMILELVKSNPSLKITDKLLYAQLVSFNLGKNIIPFTNIERYFRNWITNFQNSDYIKVYRDKTNPFICHFNSKKQADTFIKLYVPLDADHIRDGVTELFSFLVDENIVHNSKVLSSVRNDNVIIRVSNIDDANRIIKYVKKNDYLLEGLLNPNPFLIHCHKLGVIVDNHYAYNVEMTKILSNLLNELDKKDDLEKFNTTYIRNIFAKLSAKCDNEELSDLYKLVNIVLDEECSLQDFANYAIEYRQTSYRNKHGMNEISYNDSVNYFNAAIIETFNRYNNLSFVINAVKLYLNSGNTKGFTRINSARKNLSLYADRNQLKALFELDNLDFSVKYYLLKVVTESN